MRLSCCIVTLPLAACPKLPSSDTGLIHPSTSSGDDTGSMAAAAAGVVAATAPGGAGRSVFFFFFVAAPNCRRAGGGGCIVRTSKGGIRIVLSVELKVPPGPGCVEDPKFEGAAFVELPAAAAAGSFFFN